MIQISRHAEKRLRERNGLNKKSMQRMVEKAYSEGIRMKDTNGKLNKWMYSMLDKRNKVNRVVIYGHQVYLFAGNILVTVFDVPSSLKKNVNVTKEKIHRAIY